jgi:AcrR family transcriptional regulator
MYNKLKTLIEFMEFNMTTETELYHEALELYWQQGLKFTMDELSERLLISKKTLYEMVRSKEELVTKVIEHYFELLAVEQDSIHCDASLSTVERLEALLCAIPSFQIKKYHFKELKATYPNAFAVLDEKLSRGWERTFSVIDKAKAEGTIRDIDNELFSKVFAAAIEGFLTENYIDSEFSFRDKLKQLVSLLLFGICLREKSI